MFYSHLKFNMVPWKFGKLAELFMIKRGMNTKLQNQFNGTSKIKAYPCLNNKEATGKLVNIPPRIYTLYAPTRNIHLSRQRHAIPPPLLFLIRPVVKIMAIFFGRTVRQWWAILPPEQKLIAISNLKKQTFRLCALGGTFIGAVAIFFLTHLEEDPITGRLRFIAFSHLQMVKIGEMELLHIVSEVRGRIVKQNHPEYTRVLRVANNILKSNLDLPGISHREWTVTVVEDPDLLNAFVLPNGNIFIFTGMLDACHNDDQLGVILSHEITHALLQHMAEQLSHVHLVEWLLLIPLVFLWALLPDAAAIFSQWLGSRLATVMFHLPYSRAIEMEADHVGLNLAAKACYDVREASAFWERMSQHPNNKPTLEWLSTHPNDLTRRDALDSLIPAAIKFREQCDCPELPRLDPRVMMKLARQMRNLNQR